MHDYSEPGIYMFTLTVEGRKRILGTLVGDLNATDGSNNCPRIELTALGQEVTKCIYNISLYHPSVEVWKHIVMEDHIHVLVCVREKIEKHLGQVIAGLKAGCSKAYWTIYPKLSLEAHSRYDNLSNDTTSNNSTSIDYNGNVPEATASGNKRQPLFEKGYHDRILSRYGQLELLKRYIDDNPRRLAVKRHMPQLFRKYLHVVIGNQEYAAYGNIFLLREPEKVQVIVHRKDSTDEHQKHMKQWETVVNNGGVLVSPFISAREREARDMARQYEGKLIILKENGFQEYFKPSGWEFNYCVTGKLLLLAPWPHHNQHTTITREQCMSLNNMALSICSLTTEEAHIIHDNNKD